MKYTIISLFLLFICFSIRAQEGITHSVEPVGVYKEINTTEDLKIVQLLIDSTNVNRNALIDTVEKHSGNYTPPVLYFLSQTLFSLKKYDEASFWFYVAQLRARYDVNRCADKTANASNYNNTFGPAINSYALRKDTAYIALLIRKVVEYVRSNQENYDARWVNLSGMDAMSASLGDPNKAKSSKLSINKDKWPAIKTKTIDSYYSDFIAFLPKIPALQEKLKTQK